MPDTRSSYQIKLRANTIRMEQIQSKKEAT